MKRYWKDIGFVFLWIIAHISLLGLIVISAFSILLLMSQILPASEYAYIYFAGILLGGLTGTIQILIIRIKRKISYVWIISNMLANTIGILIITFLPMKIITILGERGNNNTIVCAAILGCIGGILQSLLIKRGIIRSLIWIITCIVSCAIIGFSFSTFERQMLLHPAAGVILSAAISGVVLACILGEEKECIQPVETGDSTAASPNE